MRCLCLCQTGTFNPARNIRGDGTSPIVAPFAILVSQREVHRGIQARGHECTRYRLSSEADKAIDASVSLEVTFVGVKLEPTSADDMPLGAYS